MTGFLWFIALAALTYFGYKAIQEKKLIDIIYQNLQKTLPEYYAECSNKSEQLKMSFLVVAAHLGCEPDEVKVHYFSYLKDLKLNIKELNEVKQIWALKKYEEAKQLSISFDITPASIFERLTAEFLNN